MGINPIGIAKTAITTFSSKTVSGVAKAATAEKSATINLFRFFKNGLHNFDEITGILKKLPEEEKYIGALPDAWRKLFNPSEIKAKTLEVQKAFAGFAKVVKHGAENPYILNGNLSAFERKLSQILGQECSVNYAGTGMYGFVMRIRGAGEDLALKVFHDVPHPINSSYKFHGQTVEIANAVAVNHGLKPSQRSRFYMGKATTLEEQDAFMLSEYVKGKDSGELSFLSNNFTYKRFLLEDSGTYGNTINGKITDYGKILYAFDNKAQENIAKELYPYIKKGNVAAISELKKKYKNDENFQKLIARCISDLENDIGNPCDLRFVIKDHGIRELFISAQALGAKFDLLKNFKHYKPKHREFLKSVGVL